MFGETNRIADAIADAQTRIDALDPTTRAKIDGAASLDFDEWFAMGDWATRAQMAGIVTIDEAMSLYAIHGEMPSTFEESTIAERVTYMRLMTEIAPAIMKGVA